MRAANASVSAGVLRGVFRSDHLRLPGLLRPHAERCSNSIHAPAAPYVTPEHLLREPARRAVRVIALFLLEDARHTAHQFHEAGGSPSEELHDFRVAVRRLRSWLQLTAALLDDCISAKQTRRLRKIASATGPARDLEVHLEWLRREQHGATARQRVGIDRVIERLDGRQRDAVARAIEAAARLEAMRHALARRIEPYCVRVTPDDEEAPFANALAALVGEAANALRERLAAVHSPTDWDEAHAARIAAKRLRYLLEPAAHGVRGGVSIVDDLTKLQDIAGDLHDVHVFLAEIESEKGGDTTAGLRLLDRHLRRRGREAYVALARDWLGDSAAPFFARVERLVTRLDALRT
ncbi:MAG: domain containing protein [Gemmatimonadetes bacterium]|nr:domain containing protein [Gemmatimonadota bacterium]